ncbi:hypothetical protein MMC19_004330 [Ptychographa xylographoides]|nr:hypothetical protein [Ptychographa xylographoides]
MATVFQFPPPVPPGNAVAGHQGAANKAVETSFEMMRLKGDTRGVVITIEETPRSTSTQDPPAVRIHPPSPAGNFPPPPPMKIQNTAVEQIPSPARVLVADSIRPSSPLRMSTVPEPSTTRPSTPVQNSSSLQSYKSSPVLVRHGSVGSTGTHSPVMRSMFPRFAPDVPLENQNYAPSADHATRSVSRQNGVAARPTYTPSIYGSPPSSPPAPAKSTWRNTRVLPGTMGQSLLHMSELPPPNLSAPGELLDMWEIANGEGSHDATNTYILGLRCDDLSPKQEVISFTSSTTNLYTLHAMSNALTITRTHPITPTPTITISTTTITIPSAESPLIANILPKSAELLALDHASSIAISHNLDRQDGEDLQAEALLRIRDTEAANLLWDSDSSRYYIIHPTLNDGEPMTFPFAIDEVASTISLLSANTLPRSAVSAGPVPAAPPLLSLSLATNTLTVHTQAIAPLQSPYALDTFLAAVLTLLLHLHRTAAAVTANPAALASVQGIDLNFAPPPTSALAPSASRKSLRSASKARSSRSRPESTISMSMGMGRSLSRAQTPSLSTLRPQRHNTELSQLSNSTLAEPDLEMGFLGSKGSRKGLSKKGTAVELQTNGVDLSKFQSYDLDDERLPAVTRGVLRIIYWLFGCLVWVLGVVVGVLAATVVGVGSLMKKA